MKLKSLEQFICDYCGGIIEKPEEGWLEWITEYDKERGTYIAHGYRIVHHAMFSPRKSGNCYHYANHLGCSDMYLHQMMNMSRLLSFLDAGPYHEPDYKGPRVRDLRGFVEIVRRLTIPYYEEARLYWGRALADGFFEGANPVWIYLPETLKSLIERYEEE